MAQKDKQSDVSKSYDNTCFSSTRPDASSISVRQSDLDRAFMNMKDDPVSGSMLFRHVTPEQEMTFGPKMQEYPEGSHTASDTE